MKTPREILLERHQTAVPKLDAIREKTLARLAEPPKRKWSGEESSFSLREFIFSFRWHLAGMGAAWLVIVLLNLNIGHSASLAAAIPKGKIPSPQIILASLCENRWELLELIQPAEWREAQPQKSILPQPRSQRYHEILTT